MVSDMLFLAQADNNQLIPDRVRFDLRAEVLKVFEFSKPGPKNAISRSGLTGCPVWLRAIHKCSEEQSTCCPMPCVIPRRDRPSPSPSKNRKIFFDLVIENPGKPIPEEHLSRLFDRFYRVDPSRQRKGEGSGIGLAIVKSIVEAHHGRVNVESDVRSTRFILSVPRLEKMIPETQC